VNEEIDVNCPRCKNKKIIFKNNKWMLSVAEALREIPFFVFINYCPLCGVRLEIITKCRKGGLS